jgi:hypothetical protein
MPKGLLVLLALCLAVHAQGARRGGNKVPEDQRIIQKINDLNRELRELRSKSPSGIAKVSDLKRILAEIAKINHPNAVRALGAIADDAEYSAVREEVLLLLAEMPGADEAVVGRIMRAHIAPDDPARRIARDYLLQQAQRRRREEWPLALFYTVGATEDKFLALQVMGRIESEHTLECAARLANDRSWSPDSTGLVSCGTIATSVESFEGPVAAGLLLLLATDTRFTAADEGKVRDATRTWHETDLRTYVKILELTDRDALKRREMATFLGAIGLESARAPLVRVAFNKGEAPEVRAAAATALGGLRVAREDLVERLRTLASDPEPLVRNGAMEGLGRLNVIQAIEALVSMLDGPHANEARKALGRITNQPPETDWEAWFKAAKAAGKASGK